MFCVLTGPGRYDGGVDRPPGPDGGPPPEIEVVTSRRPNGAGGHEADVLVYRLDGTTKDGEPRYVRERSFTEERSD